MFREVEGLSYDEISKIVGCSKGTVMSRLHHARKKLQKLLTTWNTIDSDIKDGSEQEENRQKLEQRGF